MLLAVKKKRLQKTLLHLDKRLDREVSKRYSSIHPYNKAAEKHKELLCSIVQNTLFRFRPEVGHYETTALSVLRATHSR